MIMLLEKAKQDSSKIILYGKIGNAYWYNKPDSANYYLNAGLELAKSLNDICRQGQIIRSLGNVNEIHGNLVLAEKQFKESIVIFAENGCTDELPKSYDALGTLEGRKGNLDTANHYFFKALKHYRDDKNNEGLVDTYIKLGAVNDASGNLDKALEYFAAGKELNDKNPLQESDLLLLNNMGIAYAKKGDMKKALSLFEEGLSKSNEPRFARIGIILTDNVGNAYDGLEQPAKGMTFHRLALQKTIEYHLPEEQSRAMVNLASSMSQSHADSAHWYLDSALVIAKGIQHKQLCVDIYGAKMELYKMQGNHKEALKAQEAFYQMKDSIFSLKKEQTILGLQTSYDLEESKVRIQDLKLANQQRTFERNVVMTLVFAVLIIVVLLWVYINKIRRLNDKLKQSNDVKDKMFSVIGHDLRGPVGSIMQMLEMLEKGAITADEQQTMVPEMRHRAELCYNVLVNLLAWGASQLRGIDVNPVVINAKEIIEKNMDVLANQASRKNIEIKNLVDDTLQLFADKDHFDFIVRNLLSNAVKFTYANGHIVFNARETEKEITFSVTDSGMGMSAEKQQQLWANEMKVGYDTTGQKGTGLGLQLCKEFVLQNKGRIWVESEQGKGTTFYFTVAKQMS